MLGFKRKLGEKISRLLSLSPEDVRFDYPPNLSLGDLSLLSAFIVGKREGKNLVSLAREYASKLEDLPMVERVVTAGPFINFKLKRDEFFLYAWESRDEVKVFPREGKNLVEHTNINPNKAAHVGHLRNAVIGDSFSRLLSVVGEVVEVQNYIDDTGVQVADVVYGLLKMKGLPPEAWDGIGEKFDHFCWDLYVEVEREMETNPSAQQERKRILKALEEGEGSYSEAGRKLAHKIASLHLQTMENLGIEYDLLTWESHIISLGLWARTFELLREKGVIRKADKGPNAGCWVMDIEEGGQLREKVIVRSNGTATYVAKDIAYQMWKLGLQDRDFKYRVFKKYPSGRLLYTTTLEDGEDMDFGRAARVYNVIDSRQGYLQKIVKEAVRRLGFEKEAEGSIHLAYEMVALSKRSAASMGFEVDGEAVSISGRKGVGIKADDLIGEVRKRAAQEVEKRHPELSLEDREAIAEKIASAAIRYYMLKFTNNSVVIFDIEDALSFEGETGPYLQYTLVRMNSIRRKLRERGVSLLSPRWRENDDYWDLVHRASRFDEVLDKVRENMELSLLAKYLFSLAQAFNVFYAKYPILNEADPGERSLRFAIMELVEAKLKKGAYILGIEIPERM